MEPTEAVRNYVRAINAHDAAKLASLVSDDHRFVDASGTEHLRGLTRDGWTGYFALFPDYRIELESIFADGESVAAFGSASGSYQGNKKTWRFPAAWRAIVHEGKLLEWRVYADVEPMMQSMGLRRFARE